jgi:hypothetical protein
MTKGSQHTIAFIRFPGLPPRALTTSEPIPILALASTEKKQSVRRAPIDIFSRPYIFSHLLVLVRHLLITQFRAGCGIATMFDQRVIPGTKVMLLAGVLACGLLVAPARAQSPTPDAKPAVAATPSRHRPNLVSKRASLYYSQIWGVDSLEVQRVESGELIRFSYRVLDADKAKQLNDKKAEPSLIDPRAGVRLVVPSLEKVGQLRQSSTPVAGKVYWMAFSNKGRLVKPGDRVNVVIGKFRAEGLVVQ